MDLYEAFGLHSGSIVAAVGGGGKTSLVYSLAIAAARRGDSAIITTSTKFTRPVGEGLPPVVFAPAEHALEVAGEALSPGAAFVLAGGKGARGRLLGYGEAVFGGLRQIGAGLITVEADGSAHRPFKAPAGHEPAIPACASDVIVCVGLGVLGKPLDDTFVHRPEIVSSLSATPLGALVTAQTVVRVLTAPAGGRKGVPPGARLHALLNNPDTQELERLGSYIGARLVYEGYGRAVVAAAHRPGDVRAVVT